MRFGVEFVPNMKYFELEYYTLFAEENNFENVWITDHYNNRNVYSMLTLLALKTHRMKIGAGVANPYSVHPAVIASAIGTVNEISGGRAVLGIAAGDKITFNRIGIKWEKPLSRLREAVEVIKLLHSGRPVKYDGEFFKMNGAKLDFKCGNCPIYIGAQGPKMLQLAAKIGDGVLINASHPKDFEKAKKNIEEGLKEKMNFDIAAYTSMSVDKDREKARNASKIVVAFIAAGSPDAVIQRHGIDREKIENVKNALNLAFTKGDWKAVQDSVDDELTDVFSISGTPEDVIERVEKLSKAGVTQVVAGSPIGPRKKDSIKLIGSKIIPNFAN
ncbi:MAG TPA: 5,10-methylenetetrahydromethanopterin reductase [Archaeoglobaceae archaeon]|nr:5,10-methylenetetrahydromethanopterin reductase [Archaeoglobaceae archaeon]